MTKEQEQRLERNTMRMVWIVLACVFLAYPLHWLTVDPEREAYWEAEKARVYKMEQELYSSMINFHIECGKGNDAEAPGLLELLIAGGGMTAEDYCGMLATK